MGFAVTPNSCTPAVQKAKYVADWHTSMLLQATLTSFINEGGFARHLRKMNRIYRERHELVNHILKKDFAEHLEVIPSVAGLHVAAVARSASSEEISDLVRRAADVGVAIQDLSKFTASPTAPRGLILGYGTIATAHIREGLNRLLRCFQR
jgi:GntR family transcriptional regulator/MocR family aminotransferase